MALTDVIGIQLYDITILHLHRKDIGAFASLISGNFGNGATLGIPHLTARHADLVVYELRNLEK